MRTGPSQTFRPRAALPAMVVVACWACWIVSCPGCNSGISGDYVENISSAKPEVATDAMNEAAEKKSTRAIVPLVKRLYSEDEAIRLSAIGALKEITGQDLGYRYYATEVERVQAIKRWEAWIVEQNLIPADQQAEPSE